MTNNPNSYISSNRIEDESRRLSLMGNLANNALYPVLLELKKTINQAAKILDVGCGTGESFQVLNKVFPDSEIIGVDLSQRALDIAEQSGIATKLLLGNALELNSIAELKNFSPFDITYIRNTLIHIPDINTVLSEIKKVTKVGGVVIAQEADWEPAEGTFPDFIIFKESLIQMMKTNNINPYVGQLLKNTFSIVGYFNIEQIRSHTIVNSNDNEWDILELLVEVASDRLLPYLKNNNINSLDELKQRLKNARNNPLNQFRNPDWVIVSGKVK